MRSIERETVRATETIDEMLSLSRIEAGAVTPRKEPVVVEDFVQDCVIPFEGAVRSRGLDVQLDLVAGSTTRPTVDADPDLFEHAFTNVLLNALRHAATTAIVSYDGSHLRVWNDGSVPSQEQLAHLFDRFYTGEHGSTGVGLAIAQEIANLHGWRLEAVLRNDGLEMAFGFSRREFT
jgi:signal transduction histidine kinase